MRKKEKDIALLYSGGLDTTYIAYKLIRKFKKIHLLTFCNGFCIKTDDSKRHVTILKRKFGSDKFTHIILPIGEIFNFLRKDLLQDAIKYSSPLLFDLCCKLSMETAAVIYCIKNNISHITDGNNPNTQGEIFLQQEEYLKKVKDFFLKYKVKYIHPIKMVKSRKKILEELDKYGINTGIKMLENINITSQLFTEPFCLWAPIAFFFTSPLRKIPFIKMLSLPTNRAINFRLEKEKSVSKLIDYYLQLDRIAPRDYSCFLKFSKYFKEISINNEEVNN